MVSGYVDNPSGHGAADMKYRFRWPAPIAGSPHDPKVIYHAANVLFRTGDGGQTWTAISPDLTRNDKRRQQWSGGPITGRQHDRRVLLHDLGRGRIARRRRG